MMITHPYHRPVRNLLPEGYGNGYLKRCLDPFTCREKRCTTNLGTQASMRTSILNPQDIDHFALEALTWFLLIISRRLFYTFHSRGLRCLTVNCRCYRSNEKPEVWFANEYRNVKTKLKNYFYSMILRCDIVLFIYRISEPRVALTYKDLMLHRMSAMTRREGLSFTLRMSFSFEAIITTV
jgi:hypothetical protein